jgi:hypothetical protein
VYIKKNKKGAKIRLFVVYEMIYIIVIMQSKKIIDGLFEETICITEGKQNQPGKAVAQNLMQCKSSCDVSNVDFFFALYMC